MHTTRRPRTGLVAVSLGFAAIAAGCGGGSSTRATPAGSPARVGSPTTVAAAPGTTRPHGPTSTAAEPPASTPASGSTATKPVAAPSAPSAAQLAAVSQDLDNAGNSLAGSNSAISDSNVNQAETQEGSAP